jgi:GNAT superfamily N-acetyltransferase
MSPREGREPRRRANAKLIAVPQGIEMIVTLERASNRLPDGFDELKADAEADGHRHLTRLAAEFEKTPAMFHAIFGGYIEGNLAGIGAITDEPALTSQPVWRMRRLYVHRQCRQLRVARAIVRALLQEVAGSVPIVTVHAGNDSAAQFWEAIGFRRAMGKAWSHETATSGATARR